MVTRKFDVRRWGLLLLTCCATAALSGCGTKETRNIIDERANVAQARLAEARQEAPDIKRYNPLVVSDKVWAGNAALRMHRGMPLPGKYETSRGIALVSSEPMTLAALAASITSQTGIPVRISDVGASSASSGGANAPSAPSMPIAYEGPLSGLLERVSGNFGVSWHYDGSTISISRFETRVFVIEALPGTSQVNEGMQDDTSSGNSGSSIPGLSTTSSSSTNTITQNSKTTLELKYWDELEKTITSMLGGTGTVVVAPSSGIVTVTTTAEIMHTVSQFLNQENKRLSHQIAINVEVYSVNLARDADFNVSFTTALHRLSNVASIDFTGPSAPGSAGALTGLGSLSVGIINPDHGPKLTDIFNALSSIGDTTRVAQFPMTTINNRPVSRRIGHDIAYVAEVGTNTSQTFQNTAVTPGTVHEGFSLQLTPRLLDDGRIIMQYSLNLIDLVRITNFTSGTGTNAVSLQLPETTNRIFVQQSVLKSGSTLVIGGVDEEDMAQNAQGVGDPFNFLLGGGLSNATGRIMLFIAITPQVLEEPRAEQD